MRRSSSSGLPLASLLRQCLAQRGALTPVTCSSPAHALALVCPAEYESDMAFLQQCSQDELVQLLRSDGRRQVRLVVCLAADTLALLRVPAAALRPPAPDPSLLLSAAAPSPLLPALPRPPRSQLIVAAVVLTQETTLQAGMGARQSKTAPPPAPLIPPSQAAQRMLKQKRDGAAAYHAGDSDDE